RSLPGRCGLWEGGSWDRLWERAGARKAFATKVAPTQGWSWGGGLWEGWLWEGRLWERAGARKAFATKVAPTSVRHGLASQWLRRRRRRTITLSTACSVAYPQPGPLR